MNQSKKGEKKKNPTSVISWSCDKKFVVSEGKKKKINLRKIKKIGQQCEIVKCWTLSRQPYTKLKVQAIQYLWHKTRNLLWTQWHHTGNQRR